MSVVPSAIPAELRALPQWVRWKSVPDEPKPRKIPVRPSDPGCASSTDPASWGVYDVALSNVGQHGTCGLGFVFTKEAGFVGIDADNCLTEEGAPNAKAADLVARFATYTEISPGGFGVHMIGRASMNGHRGINRDGVEVYGEGRYFTMTGNALPGSTSTIAEVQPALDALVAKLDPPKSPPPPVSPRPRRSDDQERIVERARAYTAKMPAAIAGQGGHEATFRVALALVKGFSLDAGTALDLLRDFNARCEPPWSEKELLHKVEDAEKADVPDRYIVERDEPKLRGATSGPTSQTTAAPAVKAEAPLSVVDLLRRVYVGILFSTGLADLNELLKGGLAPGFLFIIGGEPWIGKTTLLVQIGDALAAAGVAVFIWATDEPPEGLALRLGQLHGEEQSELTSEYPLVLERLTRALAAGPRFLPESITTVAEAVAFIERHTPAGKVPALLLDSLQSQAQRTAGESDSPRAALSALMADLNEAKKRGLIVGATSELARGGYASQDPGQRTRGLAAFAESRAIEYRSDVAMTMTATGEDLVRLEILKNRLGHRKGGLTLRLEHARARLLPVDDAAVKRRTAEEKALVEKERLHAEEDRVLDVLREKDDLTADEIQARARMQKKALLEALARLCDSGRIERHKTDRLPDQRGTVPYHFKLARKPEIA